MLNRLALLGPVSLTGPRESSIRRATQQRRIALLALIASSPGGAISRDRVLGLLWPDRDERTARHLLADSLYVLRQTLGDGAIIASGETLRLSSEKIWTDVVEFRKALAEERWPDALDLYRGDFLDGFYVRHAIDFDQWAITERARLNALAVRAATTLSTAFEKAGRTVDATTAAERALELAPGDEPSFRRLVGLLTGANNHARAQSVARTFIEYLAELGVAASAETARVLRELHAMRVDEPIVVVTATPARNRQARKMDQVTASLVMRGRHQWHHRTRSAVERAISYFTAATERDPRAVEAWCGLADSWTVMAGRSYAPPGTAIEHAATAADRALRLDDTVSATWASIGGLNIMRRRWDDAGSALRRSIALDLGNADAHHWLSMVLLTAFGLPAEAVREQTIAVSLNPVLPMLVGVLGWQRYLRREYDLSRSSMEPAVDLNADFEEGHAGLARAAARLGDEATVTKAIEAGLNRRSDLRGNLLAEHSSAFAVLGDNRRAGKLAVEASSYEAMPINLALAWASVGEARKALQTLERESFLVYWAPQAVWWDPRFDDLRDDRRFVRVHERAARAWSPEWR